MRHRQQTTIHPSHNDREPVTGRRRRARTASLAAVALILGLTACDQATIVRVSGHHTETSRNVESGDVSDDGSIVVFTSNRAYDAGDTNTAADVFVNDRNQELIFRISSNSSGGAANGSSSDAKVSGNGRYVSFTSVANNLVPGDTNGSTDVFLFDLWNGSIQRISVTTAGAEGAGPSSDAAASTDGRYVVFESYSGLVPNDTDATTDIYLRDTVLGTTTLASTYDNNTPLPGVHFEPEISGDGDVIVFTSDGDIADDDKNGNLDIYRKEQGRPLLRISRPDSGADSNGSSRRPAVNDDGTVIAFDSVASNLHPGDTESMADVFVWDAEVISLISTNSAVPAGTPADTASLDLSGDLVGFNRALTGSLVDAIVHDRATATSLVVSSSASGEVGTSADRVAAVTGNGRGVLVRSLSPNLIPGDTNDSFDLFVKSYPFPKVTTVSPATLAPGSSTLVTIDGRGFAGPMTVTADANPGGNLTIGAVTIVSSSRIRVQITVPAGAAAKAHDLTVTNQGVFPDDTAGASTVCIDCLTVS